MLPVYAAVGIALALVVFAVAFSLYISSAFLRPPFLKTNPGGKLLTSGRCIHPAWGEAVHDPKTDFGLDFEHVEFRSGGEHPHRCRGWLVDRRRTPGARPVAVVFVHGGGRDRRAFLRHSTWVCREGYSALMYDSRGHGVSDGTPGLSFGLHEVSVGASRVATHRSHVVWGVGMVWAWGRGRHCDVRAREPVRCQADGVCCGCRAHSTRTRLQRWSLWCPAASTRL